VVEDVRQGRVDLGFADVTEAERDPELDVETIRASQGVFFCRAGHPLTREEPITFDDLLDYLLVGPSYASRVLAALPKTLRRFGVVDEVESFHPRILVETFHSARRVVLASPAIAAAIPCQIERELKEGLFRSPARRGVLAQDQLRLHNQARPHALARIGRLHGDRPGD
jgi:DNA-binding transcriptional LysR family regulator